MFDEAEHRIWVDYFPYYAASVIIVVISIFVFARKLLIKDGVIYFREFVMMSCGMILGMIPMVNSAVAILLLWGYVAVPALLKCFDWLDTHEKIAIFRLKKKSEKLL
jgi:hypothetical protein